MSSQIQIYKTPVQSRVLQTLVLVLEKPSSELMFCESRFVKPGFKVHFYLVSRRNQLLMCLI